ncbi:hypothetical protein [Chitinophaga nivalis]|uniref:hypothetical protein n=1 Tax=Chitinophaga nivalis TaxID=2991709 RepID=UPI0022281CCC|nr:hypothetical protein [Chitinophaga nivalis]MCW3464863.1 hypothetical protein [Chitinophaga nivalis]
MSYNTMPGNRPKTNNNFLAIWQNFSSIPWSTSPGKNGIQTISTDTPSGDANFLNLSITKSDYIIGYAVGQELTGSTVQQFGNICATAYIPLGSTGANTVFSSSIENIYVGSTSVLFDFSLPDGVTPTANGAWAGLWRGLNPDLYGTPPTAAIQISPNVAKGTTGFNNVSIGIGTSYTIGLFMSGFKSSGGSTQSALACSASFTN